MNDEFDADAGMSIADLSLSVEGTERLQMILPGHELCRIKSVAPCLWQITLPDGSATTVAVRADNDDPAAALAVFVDVLAPDPAMVKAEEAAARYAAARAECRRRILAVVPETAQVNLTAAAAADLLPPADLATFRAGLGWIAGMRAAWPKIDKDAHEDRHWPTLPAGVAALAARF